MNSLSAKELPGGAHGRRKSARRLSRLGCLSAALMVLAAALAGTGALAPTPVDAAATQVLGGVMTYGHQGVATPYARTYDNAPDAFSSQVSTATSGFAASYQMTVKTSPRRQEAIVGYMSGTGGLQVMCFDGFTWSNEFTATTHASSSTTRRYDIAYERASGDVMVMYSTGAAATTMAYRTKPGGSGCGSANWSSETTYTPARTSSTITWVKLAFDRRVSSDRIAAAWTDESSTLSAMQWTGSAWESEPASALTTTLDYFSTGAAGDTQSFDVEYESVSGDVMVAYGIQAGNNGTNGVRYATCSNSATPCTWTVDQTPPTFLDDATVLDLSANPTTDELVFASIGEAGSDLQIGYWSGSAWTNSANVDQAAGPVSGTAFFSVATGWLVNGGASRSVVTYRDDTDGPTSWYVGNGSTFTVQTDFSGAGIASAAAPQRSMWISMDPNGTDHLMWTAIDGNRDVWAKRLTMTSGAVFSWTDSDGGTALELSTTNSDKLGGVAFAYWSAPPPLTDSVEVSVLIAPMLTFTVAGRPTACNNEPSFQTAGGSASTVDLGYLILSSASSAAQDLSVVSNAGGGFSVYLRGTYAANNLRGGSRLWTDVTGSYASPAAIGAGEGFGYTYADSTASSSVTNPGSALFVALTNTDQAVMGSLTAMSGSGCVAFTAQTSGLTAAGSYAATVIYTAVPRY